MKLRKYFLYEQHDIRCIASNLQMRIAEAFALKINEFFDKSNGFSSGFKHKNKDGTNLRQRLMHNVIRLISATLKLIVIYVKKKKNGQHNVAMLWHNITRKVGLILNTYQNCIGLNCYYFGNVLNGMKLQLQSLHQRLKLKKTF